jgi:hypothetical protein
VDLLVAAPSGATFDHPFVGADQKARELKKLLGNQAKRNG